MDFDNIRPIKILKEINCMERQVCNICGKEFDRWDKQEKFGFHYKIGYGSNYDLTKIDLNMCCGCFDKLLDCILPQCKIDPLTDISFWCGNSIVYRGDER